MLSESKNALLNCRLKYKRFSFLLDYFFPQVTRALNAPARYEVEEPFIEFDPPHGLQQLEALLFEENSKSNELLAQAKLIAETAHNISALTYGFVPTDAEIMESLHLELLRAMALYITGYDAPLLGSGIDEAVQALLSMKEILAGYTVAGNNYSVALETSLQAAINYLQGAPSFDAFDRMRFLVSYAKPLEINLEIYISRNGWQLSSVKTMDYSRGLFDGEIINPFRKEPQELITMGKKFFNDPSLSRNGKRSCASCHQPEKYFTDGLIRNTVLDDTTLLQRNTPSIFYTAYQSSQFWDGRAATLEHQVEEVMSNPLEMGADSNKISEVKRAIAAYVGSMAPLNSAFDKFMAGEDHAMSAEQLKGANLFLGKARCGTCHFIPFFNGSTPPLFDKTEFEVAGVTASENLLHPQPDTDRGRFAIYPVLYYDGAFKTPGLRNVAKTAPYFHNGAFSSLKAVVEFYNKGGGAGLGLPIPQQTLDSRPLGLTEPEVNAIVSFMEALTDKL